MISIVNDSKKTRRRKSKSARLRVTVQQKPQQTQNPKKKRKDKRNRGQKMSECARKYLAAIARPFSTEALGACLPHPPDRDSLKVTSIQRFNLTADASGNAWVQLAPTIANDQMAIWYNSTTGTVPITVVTANVAPANYTALNFAQLPFTLAQISSNLVAGRIVAVGFRITYVGPVTTMAGTFFSYADPEHGNINLASYSPSGPLFASNEAKIRRVTDHAFEQGFTIVAENEAEYVGYNQYRGGVSSVAGSYGLRGIYPWSNGGVDINGASPANAGYVANAPPCIIFGVSGSTAASAYYVEVIQHVEYVGKSASYGLTPSHNDADAAYTVRAAADRSTAEFVSKPEEPWSSTIARTLNKIVRETQTPMGAAVVKTAARGVTWLGRRRGQLRLQ